MKLPSRIPFRQTVCLGGALLGGASLALAQTADSGKVEKLEKENQELRKRLDALEAVAQKEGLMPASGAASHTIKAFSESTLSGFVTASYFYDTSRPTDDSPNGYLWNRHHNSFTLNKFKMTLASPPVEPSGDKWSAGYRVSLIFGEDAPIVNTGGTRQGFDELREAYVELNVPIGAGINVRAGQLISLLNFESGDGGAVNPNFSQGNQWFFTGNGPSTGVQLGYTFTDWLSAKVRVQNGLFTGPVDNNPYKTLMGSLDIKPDSKTSVSLLGFGGREGASSGEWLKGGSIIASRQLCAQHNVNFATELDYFNLNRVNNSTAYWWSAGGWLWGDVTPKFGIALRGDYIGDQKGAGTSTPTGGFLGFPINSGMDLYSATLTFNIRPVPSIKIQPEVRYDHTSLHGGFDGKSDRVIVGAGVSYLF